MMKKKYPMKKLIADIEVLGGEIELTELTAEYRAIAMDDPSFDTPKNALICAGLTEEQYTQLGQSVVQDLYNDIIELTYPNALAELKKMVESGEYKEPTEEEREEVKKNS